MPRRDYSCNTTFLDLLFNMLLAFVAMFVMAFALSQVEKAKPNETNAKVSGEFMIELTWDDESDDDVDLWVEGPGGLVFFSKRECGNMYLDRDDTGMMSETVQTENGPIEVHSNKEVVTIRNLVPGEYIVNVFAYALRPTRPIIAKIEIVRLRPWAMVAFKTMSLNHNGDEKTAVRFTVKPDGSVTGINELTKLLSKTQWSRGD